MPRHSGTARMTEFDLRITPTDQNPITKEQIMESDLNKAEVLIVAEEGTPNGTPVLHYHIYVKAKLSDTLIRNVCRKLGRSTKEINGNAVFFCRLAHENTIGYVVKNKNIIYHNQDQKLIDEYFELSEDYNRKKEQERKSALREKENSLKEILKEVVVDNSSTPSGLIKQILYLYNEKQIRFPTRTTLENAVMSLMYKIKPLMVEEYYTKNFLFL